MKEGRRLDPTPLMTTKETRSSVDTRTVPPDRSTLTLTDPDGVEVTVSPRNDQARLVVDEGHGRRAAAYLDPATVDTLAEHLTNRGGRDAAIDRHIQGLRTVAITHGTTPHLLAAIEHLVEDLRATPAVPAETAVEVTRPWTAAEQRELADLVDRSELSWRRRAVELGMLRESAWVLPLGQVSAYVVAHTPPAEGDPRAAYGLDTTPVPSTGQRVA
jgi:hypothetical protein